MTTTPPIAADRADRGSACFRNGRLHPTSPRLIAGAIGAVLVAVTHAADAGAGAGITWQPPQAITGDADVDTNGSLVYAYNFGTPSVVSTTVGGVTFSSFGITNSTTTETVGNVTITESPDVLWAFADLGGTAAPYTSLTSGYQSLLSSGASAGNPTTVSLTLNGLTHGTQYSFQWWTSNSAGVPGAFGADLSSTTGSGNGGGSVALSSTVGSIGQHVTGTFTALGSTQYLFFTSPAGLTAPLINAFQLRDLSATGVPGGAGLAGLIGLGAAMGRRRGR